MCRFNLSTVVLGPIIIIIIIDHDESLEILGGNQELHLHHGDLWCRS